ncbi:tetratricopeptide repeat protein [Mangrovitalea sediminis]|uniref:tetratricopeptide repeat protein n=1 Tax=Mangrovitalea sediminis TaxID=1982043 RepID=UPI000BE5640D|nr:tetratricopeptide repeat protein [Mangrovitalea sediminis]
MHSRIQALEAMLAKGQDNAMLRMTLGKAMADEGRGEEAIDHLRAAVAQDPGYSAAWSLLGKVLLDQGQKDDARKVWVQGLDAARGKGDMQIVRELEVRLRKLDR